MSSLRLGSQALDLVPVDYVASFIVHVALVQDIQAIWHGRTFHLANPEVCNVNESRQMPWTASYKVIAALFLIDNSKRDIEQRRPRLACIQPVQWSDAVSWLYDALGGVRAAMLPPKEWAHMLMTLCREGKAGSNPLARFVSLFEDNTGHDNGELQADVTNANAAVFDTDAAPCPVIAHEVMAKYVSFFVEHGYMHARPLPDS